jgi:hypothetical protein
MAPNIEGGPRGGGGGPARGLTARQRRNVRITTWVVSLIALAFYIGFIVLTVSRAHR